jgi:DNA-directed RNA polymerase subunit RPC12/RpoP
MNIRIQDALNGLKEKNLAPSSKDIETLHRNITAIVELKQLLNFSRPKEHSEYQILETLKKKFKVWRDENQGTRTLSCPHCGLMIMLKIRTDKWDAQKHPFFKDRILFNKHLVKLYVDKIITSSDVAKILDTSTDYINWLVEKWEKNPIYEKLQENESESGQPDVNTNNA